MKDRFITFKSVKIQKNTTVKTLKQALLISILLFFNVADLFPQEYSIEVFIDNQPDNFIVFGAVKGDSFTPIDSTFIYPESRKVIFRLPADSHPGFYRIVLGKTPYARVMNEPPQQFDFIFNRENIVLKTDFKEPLKKMEVLESAENGVWFEYLAKNRVLKEEIETLEKEIELFRSRNDKANTDKKINDYNTLQLARDMYITELVKMHGDLLAASAIYNQRLPVLDGFLSPEERKKVFQTDFFKPLDFTDERLIYSTIYTDRIFEYLVSYNNPEFTKEQREAAYIAALDVIFPAIRKNDKVYHFIRDYLLHGFRVLQLQKVISYISTNFPE